MGPSHLIRMTFVWLIACASISGQELRQGGVNSVQCDDKLWAEATIVPELKSRFFGVTTKSYPPGIIDHGAGKLEDTIDGSVEPEDRIQIEHNAKCISSHQGKHAMNFCDAWIDQGTTKLRIWGGFPAYASSLTVFIDDDLTVRCSFEASYPAPTAGLGWSITKKTIRLRERNVASGDRLYGWLAVEFEERAEEDGKVIWMPYEIEGYFKPTAKELTPQTANSKQNGAAKPATAVELKGKEKSKSEPKARPR